MHQCQSEETRHAGRLSGTQLSQSRESTGRAWTSLGEPVATELVPSTLGFVVIAIILLTNTTTTVTTTRCRDRTGGSSASNPSSDTKLNSRTLIFLTVHHAVTQDVPLLMLVSDLARFPADTAVLSILATTFPADPSFSVPCR